LAAGCCLQSIGDWDQALAVYTDAQRMRPQDPLAAIGRATSLARLGRLEEADQLFNQIGVTFARPCRITRMGSRFWAELKRQAAAGELTEPDPDTWQWLVPAPQTLHTLVLVSLDGPYAKRYAKSLLASWCRLHSSLDATAQSALQLHMHLMNADEPTKAEVANLARQAKGVSAAYADLAIPQLPPIGDIRHVAEYRTWYACERLRVLPWWLARVQQGVMVTDVDIDFLRSPLLTWAAMDEASAGAVRFDPRRKILWEEWYLSLALFRANDKGRQIAADLAAYVSHFLQRGEGIWSVDQAALLSVFANHGGPIGGHKGTSKDVKGLPMEWVRYRESSAYPDAFLSTTVASQGATGS
jgi:hypothetical protein